MLYHAGEQIFFSSFFVISIHFLRKLAPWMPPRVDARGRRTIRTPLCTPLIAIIICVHELTRSFMLLNRILQILLLFIQINTVCRTYIIYYLLGIVIEVGTPTPSRRIDCLL